MISGRWAVQEVFDITLINALTGQIYCKLTDVKKSSFSQDATTVYAMGGKGNSKIIGFDHSKACKLSVSNATFLADLFGVQSGSDPVVGVNTNLVKFDTLTVSSDTATTSCTPLGTADEEIQWIYLIGTDGALTTAYEQDTVVSSGKFTLSGKTLTFNTSDIPDGSQIFLKYNATPDSYTTTYSGYSDIFSKQCKIVADTIVRDCVGTDFAAQLIFYNAKIDNNFSFDLEAGGEPSIQNVEIEALKNCISTKLWDLILYDSTTVV